MDHVYHHAHRPPEVPDSLYDQIFDHGELGDWYWTTTEIAGAEYRTLHILVPDLHDAKQGTLGPKGLELIEVFPSHAPENWARPGSVNGWDGDKSSPTLSPSIFVGGGTDKPGWHGFFKAGELVNA